MLPRYIYLLLSLYLYFTVTLSTDLPPSIRYLLRSHRVYNSSSLPNATFWGSSSWRHNNHSLRHPFSSFHSTTTTTTSSPSASSPSSAVPRHLFDLLSTTSVRTCVNNNGDSNSNSSSCSLQLILTGTITNGDTDGSSVIYFDLGTSTGSSSSASLLTNDNDAYLTYSAPDTLALVLYQSSIRLLYPLKYRRDYNDQPSEIVYTTDRAGARYGLLNPCVDNFNDPNVACGYTYASSNNKNGGGAEKIPYSQGFCCRCSFTDTFASYGIPRSGEVCRFAEQHDSAHCLRMNNLWHSGYNIEAPSLDFDIVLTLVQCRPTVTAKRTAFEKAKDRYGTTNEWNTTLDSNDHTLLASLLAPFLPACTIDTSSKYPNECECRSLDSTEARFQNLPSLGPSQPTRCFPLPFGSTMDSSLSGNNDDNCDIKIDLQGTFIPYEGTPDYSSKVLLVPAYCSSGTTANDPCWNRLVTPYKHWLMVENTQLTDTGSDCNKIGVSWEAFATQGLPCNQPRNTCLSNQPGDLYAADYAAELNHRNSRYFLSNYRESTSTRPPVPWNIQSVTEFLTDRTNPNRALMIPTQRFQRSLITVTLRAPEESIRLVINIAPVSIIQLYLAPFIALQTTGKLYVTIINTGTVPSKYTVSVTCSLDYFLPVPARSLSLRPGGSFAENYVEELRNESLRNPSLLYNQSILSLPSNFPTDSVQQTIFTLQTTGTAGIPKTVCTVGIVNSLGIIMVQSVVNITVYAQVNDQGSQGGTTDSNDKRNNHPNTNGTMETNESTDGCSFNCNRWYDVSCLVRNSKSCIYQISGWVSGIGVLSLLGVGILWKYPFLLLNTVRWILTIIRGLCGGGDKEGITKTTDGDRRGNNRKKTVTKNSPTKEKEEDNKDTEDERGDDGTDDNDDDDEPDEDKNNSYPPAVKHGKDRKTEEPCIRNRKDDGGNGDGSGSSNMEEIMYNALHHILYAEGKVVPSPYHDHHHHHHEDTATTASRSRRQSSPSKGNAHSHHRHHSSSSSHVSSASHSLAGMFSPSSSKRRKDKPSPYQHQADPPSSILVSSYSVEDPSLPSLHRSTKYPLPPSSFPLPGSNSSNSTSHSSLRTMDRYIISSAFSSSSSAVPSMYYSSNRRNSLPSVPAYEEREGQGYLNPAFQVYRSNK